MKLLWLDLETTGLDPHRDAILEVAAFVADLERPFDVREIYNEVLFYTRHADGVGGMQNGKNYFPDQYVEAMHRKNNLWAECERSIIFKPTDAEEDILCHFDDVSDEERPILAGSTVHFDRSFLRRYMPELESRLSHRHYDVSSVKLFCQSLGMPKLPKSEAHRAAADIRESMNHAEHCVRWLAEWRPGVPVWKVAGTEIPVF